MSLQFIAFHALELAVCGVLTVLIVRGLRQRDRRLVKAFVERTKREERARNTFRRPKEFGPLELPWDRVEWLRVNILADQLAADEDDDPVCVDLHGDRVGLRRAPVREERIDRTWFWLSHRDDHVLALTGRGVAA